MYILTWEGLSQQAEKSKLSKMTESERILSRAMYELAITFFYIQTWTQFTFRAEYITEVYPHIHTYLYIHLFASILSFLFCSQKPTN